MDFNSKKVVLKRDVLSSLRRAFSKQGEQRRRFPNYTLQNYEEKLVVLKSKSTKRNDSDTNHRKNYLVGFKI